MRNVKVEPRVIDSIEMKVGPRMLGEIYLNLGYITQTQLENALAYQRRKGGRLGWIMGALGYLNRIQLFEGLAKHFGSKFIGDFQYLEDNIDNDLARKLTHGDMVQYQTIPFHLQGNTLTVITSDPWNQSTLDFLVRRFEVTNVKEIVITDLDLMKISELLNRENLSDISIRGLIQKNPAQSASTTFSGGQLIFFAVLLSGLVTWFYFNESSLILVAIFATQFFYLGSLVFKLGASLVGLATYSKSNSNAQINTLEENELPVYTVLLPVYKEPKVVGALIRSLKELDYPEDKLDIILLLEENDKDTLEAAKREKPPVSWRFLILPDSVPKTKPKALNYGLQFARGEYLTIYDAEDVPDPDQLKKAVVALRQHPDYICYQAALNYFNEKENILTRLFTIEYSGWFDCMLPGLFRTKLPIPLGGTSNHFDVRKLREIGAWDPYNVTEDADLGIRASVAGYKVGVIDSTTYEEAASNVNNWIRQRSRWVKGFMLTFLVHNRHPLQALKSMGLKRWLAYNLLIGGTPATFLLNPIMWALFIYSLFAPVDHLVVPPLLFYVSTFNLVVGNTLAVMIGMAGVLPRKKYYLLGYALLIPFYWVLQSIASYKALWQLITRPHYWEKTEHGISSYTLQLVAPRNDSIPIPVIINRLAPKNQAEMITQIGGVVAATFFFLLSIMVLLEYAAL
jgi:glycosyltransferase XagB